MTKKILSLLFLSFSHTLFPVVVNDEGDLNFALLTNETLIEFGSNINLTDGPSFPINSNTDFSVNGISVTINGNNNTLNGQNANYGFFIRGGTVTISNLRFLNTTALGGAGRNGNGGGGGGAGLGGSLFIDQDSIVTLINPTFSSSNATGGKGGAGVGSFAGGGGGGLKGNGATDTNGTGGLGGGSLFEEGGTSPPGDFPLAGGGGAGVGFPGNSSTGNTGATGGGDFAGAGGGAAGSNGASGAGGGGGDTNGGAGSGGVGGGGGGGGGGATANGAPGGNGGDYGGGGSGGPSGQFSGGHGGHGGFGGGGGAGSFSDNLSGGNGGNGGFAGGGSGGSSGIGSDGTGGSGGFGGGKGASPGSGGGGAGFGGAIFMREGADLTICGSPIFQKNTAIPGKSGGAAATDGTSAGVDIFMMSSSQLTFDLSSPITMIHPIVSEQGAIAGGGLTKKGSALLILKGDNTYTGDTIVESGPSIFSGSVITDVTVDAPASLSGNLTIKNGKDLTTSGRVEPGSNGQGAITIEGGTYTHESSAALVIDITPDGVDFNKLFFTSGDAVLNGGNLEVIINPGNYIGGKQYEIINAPTTGTFTNVNKTGPFANDVLLDIAYSSVILTVLQDVFFTHQNITAQPAKEVAKCITQAGLTSLDDLATVVEVLGTLNDSQVNRALTSLSATRFGALEWINARNNSYIVDLLTHRPCCNSLWVTGFVNRMKNTENYDFLRRFDANASGIIVGLDRTCGLFTYGASFNYTYTDLKWKKRGGGGKINTFLGALYGDVHCNCFALDASVLGGGSDYDLDRRMTFSIIDRKAKSDFWGYFVTAHLGATGSWCFCHTNFKPFALADYHYYTRNSFNEHGADSLNLHVQSKDQHMLRAEAGLKLCWEYSYCGSCIVPYIGGSYVGEFPLNASRQKASFIGKACVIDAKSYDNTVHLGSPTVGASWIYCDDFSFTASYKGLFNNKTRINEAEVRFDWIF